MEHMLQRAKIANSPSALHADTVVPDRLLSETAWELWQAFPEAAEKTSTRLVEWTNEQGAGGKAVLILDALSLRELYILKEEAAARNVNITTIGVTASECPSSTDEFAKALGVPGRSSIADDKKSASFKPFGGNCYTSVYNYAFEDCTVPPASKVFIWHSWLDDRIHLAQSKTEPPDTFEKSVLQTLKTPGFWKFVGSLRRGRKLLVTSDHGYAVARSFSSKIEDKDATEILRCQFKASRYNSQVPQSTVKTIPPVVMSYNNQTMVIGQNKWVVQGGYPNITHGGMSLLETLVPWIEMEAV
jgi:hypothetical protein